MKSVDTKNSGQVGETGFSDSANANRLRNAAGLLRDALRDDPRLEAADIGAAAETVERAVRVFFESVGDDLSLEDWVIRDQLTVGDSVYDIQAVVELKGGKKRLSIVPGQRIPQRLEISVSKRALSECDVGDLVIVTGHLSKKYGAKASVLYLDAAEVSKRLQKQTDSGGDSDI